MKLGAVVTHDQSDVAFHVHDYARAVESPRAAFDFRKAFTRMANGRNPSGHRAWSTSVSTIEAISAYIDV